VAEARASGLTKLVARVKPENVASRRAFEKAGFTLQAGEKEPDPLRFELSLR
jgi:RimJ/RimL family protein N-acetyltransferase